MAFEQVGRFASVKVLNHVSEGVSLDCLLQTVEKHGHELLDVLLHHYVDRLAERFVGDAEGTRGKLLTGCFLEVGKDSLNLMQQIIINLFTLRIKSQFRSLLIISPQYQIPEHFISIQLLHHTIHVTNVA